MNFKKVILKVKHINPEVFIWPIAILLMAAMDTEVQHLSLCPLKYLGFEHCPGCGLGHSIAFLFQGKFLKSFITHPLGGFTVIMLLFRTVHSFQLSLKRIKNYHYE